MPLSDGHLTATVPPEAVSSGRQGHHSGKAGTSRRALSAATVGSVVESYDWSMYAVLAPFFADQLFPGVGTTATLMAYGGFAVGFLARPIGSVLVGRLSDRRGRRFGLMLCISVIAAASLLLAVVPSHAMIGAWSAVLVVTARLIQGLAYGGEAPTVAAYITETAPPRRRSLFSGISYAGVIIGSLMSFATVAALNATLGEEGLAAGGWRWGFVAAALIGLAAIWVRRSAPESEQFEEELEAHGTQRPPVRTVFTQHPFACAALFLIVVGSTVSFYFSLVYLPVFADHIGAASKASASSFMPVVFVTTLAAMLLSGLLADRIGLIPVLRGGALMLTVAAVPLLYAMSSGSLPFDVVAVIFGVLVAPQIALANLLSGLLFPVVVRAVGAGIVGAVAVSAFGGTFPLLAEALAVRGHSDLVPYYVAAAAAIGLGGTFIATRVPGFTALARPIPDEVHP
jgi:MHS family alpha-ketoglutarate permease-like MFS transporter